MFTDLFEFVGVGKVSNLGQEIREINAQQVGSRIISEVEAVEQG
jgi:hypothetical protein